MWFKLAGADFSKNNLGTMSSISSSYLIDYTGLTGMSGSPSSVSYAGSSAGTSKTASVVVTVTSGYTFKQGSTITASGGKSGTVFTADKDYTGGQTFTFSMAITANTKLSGTAEATGGSSSGGNTGGEPETPVNPPSGGGTTYYFKDRPDSGYLNGGELIASTKSSTTDYIDISSKPKIGYFGRMGYVAGSAFHALEFYDANKTYLSSLSVLGDGKEMTVNLDLSESKYANAKYVRASVSQSSFTTEQFNSWHFVVGSFIPTLETITSMFPNLGYLDLDGKDVEATSGAYVTDYVSLSGKTNITYKGRMGTIGLNMAFYDSSKKLISGLETVGNGNFITLNINLSDSKYANAAYVKASISRGTLDETTWLSSSFKIS